jgi:glutamyl-tRNA synthetase
MIITRIAPSSTGPFAHIGNLRTLIYNYLLAKKHNGKFFVRLEDTDRDRYDASFLEYFKETLNWLGIVPDASYWNPDPTIGSFIQSERDYSDKVKFLLNKGLAYFAFDTKDDLDSLKNKGLKYDSTTRMSMNNSLTNPSTDVMLQSGVPYVIRFKVDSGIDISFTDAILGNITINSDTLDDKVLIKSNGIGSYHLCNVCDDHDMGVTHVLRGNEWVPSTPFHILLYKAFGWDIPTFAHLPLILNPDGKGKLSKRTAAKYGIPIAPIAYIDENGNKVDGWREKGFDPKSLINALALIGWNPGDDREIMSIDELVDAFSLDGVNKSSARFDMDKATWINSQHLKNTPNSCLKPYINLVDNRYSDDKIDMIIDLAKNRSDFRYQLNSIAKLFFDKPTIPTDFDMGDLSKIDFNLIDYSSVDYVKQSFTNQCNNLSIKMGKLMPKLRMLLVGGVSGPDLMTTMYILGKDGVLDRIENI